MEVLNQPISPVNLYSTQDKDSKFSIDLMSDWKEEFTKRTQTESNSRKEQFSFIDACQKTKHHTNRDKVFLLVEAFLRNKPLKNNDYVKFVSCYIKTGKKLDAKYFRNNLNKLIEYYKKADEAKAKSETLNPFSTKAYNKYVLFMALKFSGEYTSDLDKAFGVQTVGHREYNPLTNLPSVLRGELPFKVKEFDIKRAFPTFIDIELVKEYRHTVYEKIDKKKFSYLLNSNVTNKDADRNIILKELLKVYGNDADKVCTLERFNAKGGAFMDFSRYEKEYIERFITENDLVNYVRLHDGVFVLAETDCNFFVFDWVEFAIKECIKHPIENEIVNFYTIDESDKVYTSPTMYANFFIQEKFIRISTADDKIFLLKNTNNVVEYYNYKTDTVAFLKDNINEFGRSFSAVADVIAKESFSVILQGFLLIPSIELNYYSDTKNTFGLPFKNGFFEFNGTDIVCKEYTDVKGFFAPHAIQSREFKYTDEVGDFEQFLIRACTGQKETNSQEKNTTIESFKTMFGYLCHNYKDMTNNPCIVFTDADADDVTRNGRRGKSLVSKALQEVQESIIKGGREFDSGYTFVFAELEKKHNIYIIDDVPAGFKYDDLYTNILGDISCQRKGLKAETIKFKDTPKFLITSNWVVPYDAKNASTNGRFIEYKFTNYYTNSHTPKDEFKSSFFQDWDSDEWSRFYSFVFRCVKLYLQKGIIKTQYDKAGDNYKAYFNNDAIFSEFHRIINQFVDDPFCTEFTVSDFLNVYNDTFNPLRFEKMFTIRNTKRLIDAWVGKFNSESIDFGIEYTNRRKWVKNT